MQRCIQNNIVDIFLLWIWSCVHSLEIVFCDCPCSVGTVRGHGMVALNIDFCFLSPKAGGCQPQHGHDRIGQKDYGPAGLVLRSIKRRKVLLNLSLKYRCLGENVLVETLPDPAACKSKRKWETAMQKARETLRLMAPDVDPK